MIKLEDAFNDLKMVVGREREKIINTQKVNLFFYISFI